MSTKKLKSWQNREPPRTQPDRVARLLSVIALLVGAAGFWVSYSSSIPALSAGVELLDPIQVAQPLHFKVRLDNFGKTSARHMDATLSFKFQRADLPFEPSYSGNAPEPHASDLAPGAHTDLVTMNPLSLEHEHDVNFVLTGEFRIYLFGKITYKDMLYRNHEFHFCRYYQPSMPTEPTKLVLCPSYNEDN